MDEHRQQIDTTTWSGQMRSATLRVMAALAVFGLMTGAASADTLVLHGPINLQAAPDVQAIFFNAGYNGATLTASGPAVSLTQNISGVPVFFGIGDGSGGSGYFQLAVNITTSGTALAGSFLVNGCVADIPNSTACSQLPGTLLAGNLVSFGFEPRQYGEIYLGFGELSGTLQPLYGQAAYLKLNLTDFPGNFQYGFADMFGQADIGVQGAVPEPQSWLLLASGTAVLLFAKRRTGRCSRKPAAGRQS